MRTVLPSETPVGSSGAVGPRLGELPTPRFGGSEVLIRVEATALNHADLLQLRGLYPAPPGESLIPGLECSGRVLEVGEGVSRWRPGDRVMALLAGGGHAEMVAAPEGQVMPVPEGLSCEEAAALPEAGLTAWTNLVAEGGLGEGESVLVTGASGGMGRMAVQLAHQLGARVLAAGRSLASLEGLRELGAEALVELGEGFGDRVRRANGGRGVDLAFDLVGGEHLPRSLGALASRGRLVLVGLVAGTKAEIDLRDLLSRRLRLVGSVLRARSREEKSALVAAFAEHALPRLADGRLRPTVDRVIPFERIAEAYEALARGGVRGKIVVKMG